MNIPIFKLHFEKSFINKFKKGCEDILTSDRPISENKYVREFEQKFAKLIGANYAIAVTNGTVAIELALKAVNATGKTVIVPSNTMYATSLAITNAGATIKIVDIESENFALSPQALEDAIAECKKKHEQIGSVIIVHIGGIISKHIHKIKTICEKNKIPLIEDAAHAQCSEINGLKAGTIGDIGCFSFFPTKVMTSAEGGMITFNNVKYRDHLLSLKLFGQDLKNPNLIVHPGGNNYKMSEFTGLLGSMECDRVRNRIDKRNKLVSVYVKRLKNSGYSPILQQTGYCSQYKMILMTKIEREWLRSYCKEHRITLTGEVYKVPLHKQPLYQDLVRNKTYPITDLVTENHICPPLYPELTVAEINYICDILLQAEKAYEKQSC